VTTPVHLLSGFLGAGKTTLLNALLRDGRLANTGVLVNEVGTIGIDHDLVLGGSDDMLLLDGGCICCQPRGSVADGIHRLLTAAADPPQRLIVETSGATNPVPVLEVLAMTPALRERVHLASVLTVIDATQGAEALRMHSEARLQAACADRLAISKIDLARTDPPAARLGPALARLNIAAPRHLLDRGAPPTELVDTLLHAERAPAGLSLRPLPPAGARHDDPFETVAIEFAGELDAADVEAWIGTLLDAHGHNLLRVKGLLHLAGSDRPAVLQCVRDVIHPISFAETAKRRERNRVVAIGWNIHRDLLHDALQDLAGRARHQSE
jgi:G3E family GTPase